MPRPGAALAGPYLRAAEAAAALAAATGVERHDVVVVLGSGWSGAAEAMGTTIADLAVTDLPHFRPPVAHGHTGRVHASVLAGLNVLTFLGRTHLYEGYGTDPIAHAVRTAAAAGCRLAVLTGATASLRPQWGPGAGVLIRDHLDLAHASPLEGPRFLDLTDLWTARLRHRAQELDPGLVEGVYAMLRGPQCETIAEALMLRTLGADVVGRSCVSEAIAAREARMEVLGLSVVTSVEASGQVIDPRGVAPVVAATVTRLGGVIAALIIAESHESPEEVSRDG
jgi:purine-nucleoside phosphorylase